MQPQVYLQSEVKSTVVALIPDAVGSLEEVRLAAGLSRLCHASVQLACHQELPPPTQAVFPSSEAPGPVSSGANEGAEGEAEARLKTAEAMDSGEGDWSPRGAAPASEGERAR